MKKTFATLLLIMSFLLVGCSSDQMNRLRNTLRNESVKTIIAEYSFTPTGGFMAAQTTRYVFYGDGSYKKYLNDNEINNYDVTLTSDQINRLRNNQGNESTVKEIVNEVYVKELKAFDERRNN